MSEADKKALANATLMVDSYSTYMLHLAVEYSEGAVEGAVEGAKKADVRIVKALLDAGANADVLVDSLHPISCIEAKDEAGCRAIVEALLEAGAELKAEHLRSDLFEYNTVLAKVLIEKLMETGVSLSYDQLDMGLNSAVSDYNYWHNELDTEGEKNALELMKVLIKAGADITQKYGEKGPLINLIQDKEIKDELIALAAKPHIVRQVSNFIMTGKIGRQNVQGKDDFIDKMAGAIQRFRQNCGIGGEGEGLGDNDKAAARKAAEVIYDELDRMSQRESVNNRTFMEFIENLARAAKAFFTDLIFGEDKAATRSTVQEALQGNTIWKGHGLQTGEKLHEKLKGTMTQLREREPEPDEQKEVAADKSTSASVEVSSEASSDTFQEDELSHSASLKP